MDSLNNETVNQARNETLGQAVAFEELIRVKGWEYVKAYYQTRVQSFATRLLVSDSDIAEFEAERQQLIGIKKLLGFIDGAIQLLEHERKNPTATSE